MTEVNENSDSGINSASIQLNEDDWLQLLQKLTPSSIESLQQTLKRLQTPEHNTTDKPNPSISLSNHSAAIHPSQSVIGQAHPIVMSLGMTKAPIAPVMAMPHVLNISKNAGNSLPGRIVLPSSALLIAPQAPGQTYSLDSCVPVADLSRLVVTSGCLPNATTGLLTAASVPDTFSSLNTLANAAVAMAASASHWPPSVSVPSTTTTVQQSNTFQFSPNLCTSTTSGTIVSPSSSVGELMHTTSNSTSDLATPLISSLGQTSLTVYPVHVSANGSTVLMAAPVTTTTTSTAAVNISRPCITTNTSVSVSSSSFGNYLNSVGETSTLSPLSITCNSNLSTNSVTSPGLVMSSTPRGKPKFKALWESTLSSNSDRINQPSTGGESSTNYDQTMSRSLEECTTATITTTTTTSGATSRISRSNKRQSPMLGAKSIGQTPKRLAATAASLSQENKSNSSDGCRKKFLLICSPPKNTPIKSQMELDSGTFLPGNNPNSESNVLSAVTSSSSSSSVEVNAIESHKSTSGQPTTMSDDRETLSKVAERNSTVTTASANSNSLKHCTGSNISSSRDSSDIADSDPIGCEVFVGKTFESGRRSLKEETVSDDEARRRAKRRERNRVAAAKCRQRRQDQIEELQHRVDALTRTGQELRSSLRSLDLERAKLETLIEEHKIAGCPAAEKILSMSKNYSDNSGSFENYADNLKRDELMMDSGYCDDESTMPVASLSSPSTVDSSTTLTTVTTSNSGGSTSGSCKPISNLVNIHPCPPKLDIRCHNIRPNTSSSSSSSIPFVSNTSVVITVGAAIPTTNATSSCITTTTTNSTRSSSGSNDNNSIITNSNNNNTHCLILSTNEDHNQSILVLKPEPEASGASRCATTATTSSTNTITTVTGSTPSTTTTTTTTAITTTTVTPSVGTTTTTTTSVTRLISRPSTLLPLSTLSTSTTSAQPLDMLKAQRQALSKVADCVNQVIPSLSNTSTSCFWSSNDLQNLSPILTPSTWKLLKNLTSASNNNSSIGNNNNNNNNGNNNNSSSSSSGSTIGSNTIQQSFLLTPTLSPLYSALPAQTFTSLTSMETLGSINNNNNSNNISTTIGELNSLSNVNNTSQSVISGQHTNVASLLFSTKVASSNCDSSKNELSSHLHHPSPLSTITNTTTTTTTHHHHHHPHHHHGNSNDELSHSVQIQQSTQLNGQ